jgi:hypothetical protein
MLSSRKKIGTGHKKSPSLLARTFMLNFLQSVLTKASWLNTKIVISVKPVVVAFVCHLITNIVEQIYSTK